MQTIDCCQLKLSPSRRMFSSDGYECQDFQSDKMKTKKSFPRVSDTMPGGEEEDGDLEENPPFLFYDEKVMTIHQYLQGLKKTMK